MGPLFGAISCHEICAVSGVDAMAVLVAMHHQEMERHELLIRLGLVLIDAAFSFTVKNFTNFRRVFDQEICTYTQENWG